MENVDRFYEYAECKPRGSRINFFVRNHIEATKKKATEKYLW